MKVEDNVVHCKSTISSFHEIFAEISTPVNGEWVVWASIDDSLFYHYTSIIDLNTYMASPSTVAFPTGAPLMRDLGAVAYTNRAFSSDASQRPALS